VEAEVEAEATGQKDKGNILRMCCSAILVLRVWLTHLHLFTIISQFSNLNFLLLSTVHRPARRIAVNILRPWHMV
jgi:hypothetical protein